MSRPTPVLFLDLDGTVRHGKSELGHFVNGPEDVEIFPGVVDKMRAWKSTGGRIVSISNQGGIALGFVSDNAVNRAMMETNRLCANLFDSMQWCPHHPEAKADTPDEVKELRYCWCRKPQIGMILGAVTQLAQNHPDEYYRPYACTMVGDRDEDRICAENAGIRFIWAKNWREEGI